DHAEGRDPLEYTNDGREGRHESYDGRPHLAHVWAETPHHALVQDLARPAARGEGAGRGRVVYESADQCRGVLVRQKIPDPGPRPRAPDPADGHRPARTTDPQLHPEWDARPLRRAERRHRRGARALATAASCPRLPAVSARH